MESKTDEQSKTGSPTWLALAAAVSFVLLSVLSIRSLASHFQPAAEGGKSGASATVNQEGPALVAAKPKNNPQVPKLGAASWVNSLYVAECPEPCSAGPLCKLTPQNQHPICGSTGVNCKTCASKMTCIPGRPEEDLTMSESWVLHLSAIYFADKTTPNSPDNPCSKDEDMYLCVRPSGTEGWQCLSQLEACKNGYDSVAGVPIAVRQLVESGIDVSIRSQYEQGAELALRNRAHFPSGLRRRGLCSGYKLDLEATGTDLVWFTFFLKPSDP